MKASKAKCNLVNICLSESKKNMSVPIWGWISLAFIGLLLGCQNISNEDLGFQLHAAKVIIANADVPRVEPFLWTEPNGSYIDMQWLWQLGIYSCWQMDWIQGPRGDQYYSPIRSDGYLVIPCAWINSIVAKLGQLDLTFRIRISK